MSLLAGSDAKYLTWKISKCPAQSSVFMFNDCKWRLDLSQYCDISHDYHFEEISYSLELVNLSVPSCEMQPFSVTCYARRREVRGGYVSKVTDCKSSNSSYNIWKEHFHRCGEAVQRRLAIGVQENIEIVVIFHKEVGPTFSSKSSGGESTADVLNLDVNRGLSSDLGSLLASGEASDVQLKCGGGVTRSAHWSVLVARSPVFSAMYRCEMAERRSGVVDMGEVDASTMDLFLLFLYTGAVAVLGIPQDALLEVYALADKYEVLSLKKLCRDSVVGRMDADNCLGILGYANGRGDVELADAATAYILDHPACLKCEAWFQFSKEHSWLANEVYRKFYDKVYFD